MGKTGKRLRATATHRGHGHPWTAENTRFRENGRRICRICEEEMRQVNATKVRMRPGKTDPVQVAAFRAADEAGVLDTLLMRRAGMRLDPVA